MIQEALIAMLRSNDFMQITILCVWGSVVVFQLATAFRLEKIAKQMTEFDKRLTAIVKIQVDTLGVAVRHIEDDVAVKRSLQTAIKTIVVQLAQKPQKEKRRYERKRPRNKRHTEFSGHDQGSITRNAYRRRNQRPGT